MINIKSIKHNHELYNFSYNMIIKQNKHFLPIKLETSIISNTWHAKQISHINITI